MPVVHRPLPGPAVAPNLAPPPAAYVPAPRMRVVDDPTLLKRHIAQAQIREPPGYPDEPLPTKRRIDMEAGVVEVLDACELMHLDDKRAEKTKRRLMRLIVVCIVLGAFTLHLHGLGVVFLALAAISGIWRFRVAPDDVEDRKLDVVSGVLVTFGPELKAGRPVRVTADFSYHEQQPATSTEGGVWGGASVSTYAHPWLSMRLPLADGSTVLVEATTLAKVKRRRKRKYRKIADRSSERLTVTIAPPRGRSFHPSITQGAWTRPSLPDLTLRRGVMQPRSAMFEYGTGSAWRRRERRGWTSMGLDRLLDSRKVVAAIIASYRTAANAERQLRTG